MAQSGFGVAVGTGVRVAVGAGVDVFCGVDVGCGVSVGAGVAVGVGISVDTIVGTSVGTKVGTSTLAKDRVAVGVVPGFNVPVADGDGFGVAVGCAVATGVTSRGSTRRLVFAGWSWVSFASSSAAARMMSGSSGSIRLATASTE
jgi:hypothetical protein